MLSEVREVSTLSPRSFASAGVLTKFKGSKTIGARSPFWAETSRRRVSKPATSP